MALCSADYFVVMLLNYFIFSCPTNINQAFGAEVLGGRPSRGRCFSSRGRVPPAGAGASRAAVLAALPPGRPPRLLPARHLLTQEQATSTQTLCAWSRFLYSDGSGARVSLRGLRGAISGSGTRAGRGAGPSLSDTEGRTDAGPTARPAPACWPGRLGAPGRAGPGPAHTAGGKPATSQRERGL